VTEPRFALEECDFCAIARGEGAAEVVCEGDSWVAFFPLEPATPGHTLIIPRKHVPDLWSLDPEDAGAMMKAVIRVGEAIEIALSPQGMNLITSAGEAASQTVYHLHLHVVPRWHGDGFGRIWPHESHVSDRQEADAAARVRAACADD
jgi:histidine triad (HIT) family protein